MHQAQKGNTSNHAIFGLSAASALLGCRVMRRQALFGSGPIHWSIWSRCMLQHNVLIRGVTQVDPKSVIVANQGCNLASFCPWRGEWPITPSQGLYCPAIKQGCLRHPPTRIHTKHLSISSFSSFNYSFSSLLQDKEPVE